MNFARIRPWLIGLYPQAWRERYGAEFDLLLEQCLHSPLDVVDVFLGAVDAHLQLLNGENVNWRTLNMLNKLRTALLIVFSAFIGFILAGFALVGIADDSPMLPLMRTSTGLAAAWTTIQAGAVVALLAIVIGGLPLALTIFRRALHSDRRSLGFLLVPVVSLCALLLYAGFVFLVSTGRIQITGVYPVLPAGNFPVGNRLLLAGLMLVFVLGAVASTLAVWKVVTNTDVEQQDFHAAGRSLSIKIYQFALLPAQIATLCMTVILAGTLAWGWQSFTLFPQVFSGNYGPWQTNTQVWYFGILTVMVLSVLAACLGLMRSRSART